MSSHKRIIRNITELLSRKQAKATDGKYTFVMPSAAVTLKAVFVEDPSASGDDEDSGIADLFNDGENNQNEENTMGLEDLVNEGASGTDSASGTGSPTDPVTEGSISIKNFESEDKTEGENPTSVGSILSDHEKANVGDLITLTINPADGYELEDGTLRAIYKNAAGKKIRYTIAKTSSGQYKFTMPEVKEGEELTFDASFKKKPAGKPERSLLPMV